MNDKNGVKGSGSPKKLSLDETIEDQVKGLDLNDTRGSLNSTLTNVEITNKIGEGPSSH